MTSYAADAVWQCQAALFSTPVASCAVKTPVGRQMRAFRPCRGSCWALPAQSGCTQLAGGCAPSLPTLQLLESALLLHSALARQDAVPAAVDLGLVVWVRLQSLYALSPAASPDASCCGALCAVLKTGRTPQAGALVRQGGAPVRGVRLSGRACSRGWDQQHSTIRNHERNR